MGLWPAALLAQQGARVTVLEAGSALQGASWAAAGMLAPASEAGETDVVEGPMPAFGAHSLSLWHDWVKHFAVAGQDINWRPFGAVLSAFDEAGMARLERTERAAAALELAPKPLTPEAARRLEPALSAQVRCALHIPGEASVDPRRVLAALQIMLAEAGGKLFLSHKVVAVTPDQGGVHVRCANGAKFVADRVLVAAGFLSGSIDGIEAFAGQLQPVKGQMLALAVPQNPVHAVMRDAHAYIVPRGDGRMIIGATSEPGKYDVATDETTISNLKARAVAVVPTLEQARITDCWAGVRPQSRDGLPILGPISPCGRVLAHCGHHRNGVLLAPASAQITADLILEKDPTPFAAAFSPARFSIC
jgi:glycine oxidase